VRGSPYGSARALLAFRDGDSGTLGMAGAMLLAEGVDHLRFITEWLKGLSKGAKGSGKGAGSGRRSGLGMRGRRRR